MCASGGVHRTSSADAHRTCAVVEYTAPVLAEFAAPSTGTSPSVVDLDSARGQVRRVNAYFVRRASSSGRRTSVQRLSCRFCQRPWSNKSRQHRLSRARLSQRSTASMHRRPLRCWPRRWLVSRIFSLSCARVQNARAVGRTRSARACRVLHGTSLASSRLSSWTRAMGAKGARSASGCLCV